jgi:hypothetical protein
MWLIWWLACLWYSETWVCEVLFKTLLVETGIFSQVLIQCAPYTLYRYSIWKNVVQIVVF